jgi:hypothetical protein
MFANASRRDCTVAAVASESMFAVACPKNVSVQLPDVASTVTCWTSFFSVAQLVVSVYVLSNRMMSPSVWSLMYT